MPPMNPLRDWLSDPDDKTPLAEYFAVGVAFGALVLWFKVGTTNDVTAWPPGVILAVVGAGLLTVLSNRGRPFLLRAICKGTALLWGIVGLPMLATAGSVSPYVPNMRGVVFLTLASALSVFWIYMMFYDGRRTRSQRRSADEAGDEHVTTP